MIRNSEMRLFLTNRDSFRRVAFFLIDTSVSEFYPIVIEVIAIKTRIIH